MADWCVYKVLATLYLYINKHCVASIQILFQSNKIMFAVKLDGISKIYYASYLNGVKSKDPLSSTRRETYIDSQNGLQ